MQDAFFVSLSKSVLAWPGRPRTTTPPRRPPGRLDPPGPEPVPEQERVRPPYNSVVQMSAKRGSPEGGQVLIFIAVQSEPLAEELVRSCNQLRKRRTLQHVSQGEGLRLPDDDFDDQFVPSRGCPTPRTLGS